MFKQVDAAVLEVGLGGKYDATNVVRSMLILSSSIQIMHSSINFS
jgi:folylpolyglutamate synthase/dihydropteroate synthase